MRLGQLARKLDKKPQELVDFLEQEHQITLETDLNTKVESKALDAVMEAFKKKESVEVIPEIVEEVVEVEEPEDELLEEEIDDKELVENPSEVLAETKEEETTEKMARVVGKDGEKSPELIVENGVIKAPKPELDGLTVVGKIELPTIKRSVQFLVTNGDNTVDVTEEIHEKRKADTEVRKQKAFEERKQRRAKQQQKHARKVLTDATRKTYADKRVARKKTEIDKRRQKNKKKHYEENVQKKATVLSKQKKKKEIEKAVKKRKAPKQTEPTTVWGKFKRWLNT